MAYKTVEAKRANVKAYYQCNKAQIKERARFRWAKEKFEVMAHLCGTSEPFCQCCGELEIKFLSIDHINGDGRKLRVKDKSHKNSCRWIKKHGYPEGFQVLCHNCNFAKGHFDSCPHQTSGDKQSSHPSGLLQWTPPPQSPDLPLKKAI